MRKAALGLGLALMMGPLCPAVNAAARGAGTTTAQFLDINMSPRPAGMSDAFTGLADDINAVLFNPAGLGFLDRQELALAHHQYFEGIKQEWGAYAVPVGRLTLAGSFNLLFVDAFEGYDTLDRPIGGKSAQDAAFGGSAAIRLTEWLAVGGTSKYISSRLDNRTAKSAAVDGGLLVRATDWLSFGGAVMNVGSAMRFYSQAFDLPTAARAGVAAKVLRRTRYEVEDWDEVTLLADAVLPRQGQMYVTGGAEYLTANFIALRAGMSMGRDAGPGYSLGLGVNINRHNPDRFQISFDYAFVDNGELNFAHRAGVTMRFGGSRVKKETDDRYWRKSDAMKAKPKKASQGSQAYEPAVERLWIR